MEKLTWSESPIKIFLLHVEATATATVPLDGLKQLNTEH